MSTHDSESWRPDDSGAIVLPPGGGRTISGLDEVITLKLTDEQTRGSIGLLEATTPPGAGPPRHIHRSSDELFYVLAGRFLFLVGERVTEASPGTLVFIPRGTVHAVKVIGSEPGKVLAAYVPGGPEGAFEEPGRLPRDVVAEKCDSEFVGPPCDDGAAPPAGAATVPASRGRVRAGVALTRPGATVARWTT